MNFEDSLVKKMSDFPRCPKCGKEGMTVSLVKGENCLVCPLCGFSSELTSEEN